MEVDASRVGLEVDAGRLEIAPDISMTNLAESTIAIIARWMDSGSVDQALMILVNS
ncbi:hypothetical protein K2Y11_10710 [bacterium]|nr:hypothetical protein [bacterium]